jgi:hypothetical protein
VTRAGGGGGAGRADLGGAGGAGGSGGGGKGVSYPNNDAGAGGVNTGGGGGGSQSAQSSANGGSGIVIIAYPDTFPAITSIGGGLTYSVSTVSRSGYRVYSFTAGTGSVTI